MPVSGSAFLLLRYSVPEGLKILPDSLFHTHCRKSSHPRRASSQKNQTARFLHRLTLLPSLPIMSIFPCMGQRGENVDKQNLALQVIERLQEAYPDADCTLDYNEAWKLLVSVRLAAQCTDARVNIVVQDLYAKYPTMEALADAPVEDIERIVHPCGLGNSKARDISACMKMLRDTYGGRVPDTMEELLALPGVGRKSANLVLGDVFGKPAIVTDTHCIRLANRIGLVDGIREPARVEKALRAIVPPEEGNALCHRFVLHGRAVCSARTHPACDACCLSDICEKHLDKP